MSKNTTSIDTVISNKLVVSKIAKSCH